MSAFVARPAIHDLCRNRSSGVRGGQLPLVRTPRARSTQNSRWDWLNPSPPCESGLTGALFGCQGPAYRRPGLPRYCHHATTDLVPIRSRTAQGTDHRSTLYFAALSSRKISRPFSHPDAKCSQRARARMRNPRK